MGRGKNANHQALPFLLCSWDRPRLPSSPQTGRGSKGRDKRRKGKKKRKKQGRVNSIRGYMERKRGGNKTGDKNWERKEKQKGKKE